jgi:hypothetical protein
MEGHVSEITLRISLSVENEHLVATLYSKDGKGDLHYMAAGHLTLIELKAALAEIK